MKRIYANNSINISEARGQISKLINESKKETISLLQNGKVKAYLVHPDLFASLLLH